ncbi:response regulator FixJ [Acidocella aminolytica]|jgi:two-component system response regulator FixJ|uniref:Transcriptional regulator n=1 Tax=Acidocella aminolytica 101 = DSM 11237 TaxID=1120923 RepID=A0A0D6PII2_9PROT|nr:response regulator FixJ [Acidocella aminolytica]GAN81477.1 transcriptional regulator [Acidocella aminolytica 101 = DSM 11237]GBQ41384.1 response regulator [Acidocella aminolytica 101 = DSM 11237]SHF03378.1 two component transcriptional regulator, LuxR family [Acidocella aminolytica 101 = DSM 11237]
MKKPVVYLIDDDEAVRHALNFLLTSAGFPVKSFESANAFLQELPALPRGCVVTDIRMPGLSGLDLQRELNSRRVKLPVIVMTGHGDVALAVRAMKEGAMDFIEKPFTEDTFLTAVQEALDRDAEDCVRTEDEAITRTRLVSLTPRETQVLDRLVNGLPNKTIAYDLKISARTVEVHRANIMSKMGASSLPDLVRMVLLTRPSSVS